MRLFSYIVTHDTGFSPNPFFGYCTLACCKPQIRRSAKPGDWVVGLTPKSRGNDLLYAMKVEEKLTFEEYWNDPRFEAKKPRAHSERLVELAGDNIYEPLPGVRYRQLRSRHSNGDQEDPFQKRRDLGGEYALVSEDFYYFGSSPVKLPEEFRELIVGRAHKCRFPAELVASFERWVRSLKKGVSAPPTKWRDSDDSWRSRRSCGR